MNWDILTAVFIGTFAGGFAGAKCSAKILFFDKDLAVFLRFVHYAHNPDIYSVG